jgi:hypothetical protein
MVILELYVMSFSQSAGPAGMSHPRPTPGDPSRENSSTLKLAVCFD